MEKRRVREGVKEHNRKRRRRNRSKTERGRRSGKKQKYMMKLKRTERKKGVRTLSD